MYRLAIPLILLSAFLSTACKESTDSTKNTDHSKGTVPKTSISFAEFWAEFQSGLQKPDPKKIADLTTFPLEISIANQEGFENLKTKIGFVNRFDVVFPPEVVQFITKLSAESTATHVIETNAHWTIPYNHDDPVSEQEWSIIYKFSRIENGTIRLVAIDFAG